MKINKEFKIAVAVSVFVAAFAVSYLITMKIRGSKMQTTNINGQYQKQYETGAKTVPAVGSTSDLESASKSLDSTDTTQIDKQLNQLDTDTSTF